MKLFDQLNPSLRAEALLKILLKTWKKTWVVAQIKSSSGGTSSSLLLEPSSRSSSSAWAIFWRQEFNTRILPMKMMKYRLALQLYKLYNTDDYNEGWLDLNFQQNFNGRNNYVQIMDCSRIMIGKNNIVNRLNCVNNCIDYDWLNQSFESFKIKCKNKFLNWQSNSVMTKLLMHFLKSNFIYIENKNILI